MRSLSELPLPVSSSTFKNAREFRIPKSQQTLLRRDDVWISALQNETNALGLVNLPSKVLEDIAAFHRRKQVKLRNASSVVKRDDSQGLGSSEGNNEPEGGDQAPSTQISEPSRNNPRIGNNESLGVKPHESLRKRASRSSSPLDRPKPLESLSPYNKLGTAKQTPRQASQDSTRSSSKRQHGSVRASTPEDEEVVPMSSSTRQMSWSPSQRMPTSSTGDDEMEVMIPDALVASPESPTSHQPPSSRNQRTSSLSDQSDVVVCSIGDPKITFASDTPVRPHARHPETLPSSLLSMDEVVHSQSRSPSPPLSKRHHRSGVGNTVFSTPIPQTSSVVPSTGVRNLRPHSTPISSQPLKETPRTSPNRRKGHSPPHGNPQVEWPPLFSKYMQAYPEYNGDLAIFLRGCKCLAYLEREGMLCSFLYDDFLRAFSVEYLAYIDSLSSDETPITAIRWYNERIERPIFTQGVVTKHTLSDVSNATTDSPEAELSTHISAHLATAAQVMPLAQCTPPAPSSRDIAPEGRDIALDETPKSSGHKNLQPREPTPIGSKHPPSTSSPQTSNSTPTISESRPTLPPSVSGRIRKRRRFPRGDASLFEAFLKETLSKRESVTPRTSTSSGQR